MGNWKPEEKPILCQKCKQGGGTLHRIEKDVYEHEDCVKARTVGKVRRRGGKR